MVSRRRADDRRAVRRGRGALGAARSGLLRLAFGVFAASLLVCALPAKAESPASPPPSASAAAAQAVVRLGDAQVVTLRRGRGGVALAERARLATSALEKASRRAGPDDVRVEAADGVAVLYAGEVPFLQLDAQDAALANDASLEVHAAAAAARARDALAAERRRSQIANTVLSLSLVVFLSLVAVFVGRKLGEFVERARAAVERNAHRVPGLRVRDIEVMRPALVRSALDVGLGVMRWVVLGAVAYAWLVVVLSLFESTRGYTEKLTGFVLGPLSGLMGRVAGALPLVIVFIIAAAATAVLVRFVGLFFASVARGETSVEWLSADLAPATSALARGGIVVAALVFAAPVVIGEREGALGRAGLVLVAALGLGAVPLLASGAAGAIVLFGRRLRVGDHVEIAGRAGRVVAVDLLSVRLVEAGGGEVRVPHLAALWHPTRVLGARARARFELVVAASAPPDRVLAVLLEASRELASDPQIELTSMDAGGARWVVEADCEAPESRALFQAHVAAALARAEIPLGGGRGA
ncbi:MAG: mechanosensitive ion channel [Polyangiaceae bacterium]|nr:mechanosensitive ion channel [Polyangiaceae bacterium]